MPISWRIQTATPRSCSSICRFDSDGGWLAVACELTSGHPGKHAWSDGSRDRGVQLLWWEHDWMADV